MFICTCHKLTLAGGRIVQRGDKVPEAAEWPENIRRANLRLGYIAKDPDYKAPAVSLAAAGAPPVSQPVAVTAALATASSETTDEAPTAENRNGYKKKNLNRR